MSNTSNFSSWQLLNFSFFFFFFFLNHTKWHEMTTFATFYSIPCIQCSTEITHIKVQLTPIINRPIFTVPKRPPKLTKNVFSSDLPQTIQGASTRNFDAKCPISKPYVAPFVFGDENKISKINVQGLVQRAAMEGLVQYATQTANSNYLWRHQSQLFLFVE